MLFTHVKFFVGIVSLTMPILVKTEKKIVGLTIKINLVETLRSSIVRNN